MEDKSHRVARYQAQTVKALLELVAAAGLSSPAALGPEHVMRRTTAIDAEPFSKLYTFLGTGELLDEARDSWYRQQWDRASAESFLPS